jgi:hypothetical protein
MTLTYTVICLACIALGVIGTRLRMNRRDAVYSYQSTPALQIRADNLTDEELARFMDNIEAAHKNLLNTERSRPPCPTCGAPIHVERIDVTAGTDRDKVYVPGGETRCTADEGHDIGGVAWAWLKQESDGG